MSEMNRYKETFRKVCEPLEDSWPAGCMDAVEKTSPELHKKIQDSLREIEGAWGKEWEPFVAALFDWRVACNEAIKLFTHGNN